MERVYTNYTASGRQVVLHNVPASFANINVENIRLIFNETQKDEKGEALAPLASTGKKENILSVTYNGTAKTVTIVLAGTVPAISSTDKLTIKVDMGDGLENIGTAIVEIDTSLLALESTTAKDATVAKEAQATLNKQAVLNAITAAQAALKGSDDTATLTAIKTLINTLAQSIPSVANIQDGLAKESQTKDGNDTAIGMLKDQTNGLAAIKTAIGNITLDTSNLATKAVEQWLGLEESYEAEAKGGERTNNTVIDECKVRFQEAFNGLLPTGFTMPNSVTVDNLTYTGTTNS